MVNYTSPSLADLKAKMVERPIRSQERKHGKDVVVFDCPAEKFSGAGFYNNPFRDLING